MAVLYHQKRAKETKINNKISPYCINKHISSVVRAFFIDYGKLASNYAQSKKAHRAILEENHVNNSALFLMISTTSTPKTLSPLERFEEGLIKKLEEFRLIEQYETSYYNDSYVTR